MMKIRKQDIKVIDKNDIRFVYYVPKGLLLELEDENLKNLCTNLEAGIETIHDSTFKNLAYTIQNGPKPIFKKRTEALRDITLNLSGNCNLRCPYCFARNDNGFAFGDFSLEEAESVIDFCITHEPLQNNFNVIFFGGEPTLNFTVMKTLVETLPQKYPTIKFNYSMTTNGVFVTHEMLSFFKKHNFSILLSFDGIENNRPLINGKSSTDLVLKNIKKYQQYQIPISLRPTILQRSNKIFENFLFFEHIGIEFEYAFAFNTLQEKTNLTDFSEKTKENVRNQLENIAEYYIDAVISNKNIYCKTLINKITDVYMKILSTYGCSAGYSNYTFNNNGDIFTCQNNASGKNLACGNIYSEGINHRKRQRSLPLNVTKIKDCKICWARYLCAGGCMSNRYASKLKKTENNHEQCEFIRMEWEVILYMVGKLSKNAPDFFTTQYKQEQNRLSNLRHNTTSIENTKLLN